MVMCYVSHVTYHLSHVIYAPICSFSCYEFPGGLVIQPREAW